MPRIAKPEVMPRPRCRLNEDRLQEAVTRLMKGPRATRKIPPVSHYWGHPVPVETDADEGPVASGIDPWSRPLPTGQTLRNRITLELRRALEDYLGFMTLTHEDVQRDLRAFEAGLEALPFLTAVHVEHLCAVQPVADDFWFEMKTLPKVLALASLVAGEATSRRRPKGVKDARAELSQVTPLHTLLAELFRIYREYAEWPQASTKTPGPPRTDFENFIVECGYVLPGKKAKLPNLDILRRTHFEPMTLIARMNRHTELIRAIGPPMADPETLPRIMRQDFRDEHAEAVRNGAIIISDDPEDEDREGYVAQ